MKNPKSNYIGDAWRLRRKRLIIRGIIVGAVILVVAFTIFFIKILNMKDDFDAEFSESSDLVSSSHEPVSSEATASGEDTSDSALNSDPSEPADSATGTSDTSTSEETTDTELPPTTESTQYTSEEEIETDEDGNEVTTTTTISLLPDESEPRETVLFPTSYPLQTITHSQRDQSYANLKHAVKKYIEENDDARIGFYYINLSTNESFGYNEALPFVVGSSIYLPMVTMFYDDVRAGSRSTGTVVAYHPDDVQGGTFSSISDMPDGKQYYLGQLADQALSEGDSVALQMLLNSMGGTENVLKRLSSVTPAVDYATNQHYTDFQGNIQTGAHRSSPYDLASYAETLYWNYMSYPESYQDAINALGASDPSVGISRGFPADTTILHRPGTSTTFHSQSDVAIILSSEPVIVCVTVETEDPEKAQEVQTALGALVYNFISYCHA